MELLLYMIIIFGVALMVSVRLLNKDWHRTVKRDGYGAASVITGHKANR